MLSHPALLGWYHDLAVDQLRLDDFFRLGFAGVHQPHPLHRVAGLQLLRRPRRFRQLRHHQLQPAVGCVLDLQQVLEQGPVQRQSVEHPWTVLLQIRPAHPPVLAQVPVRLLSQGQVGKQNVPLLPVSQNVLHGRRSFPRIFPAHTF